MTNTATANFQTELKYQYFKLGLDVKSALDLFKEMGFKMGDNVKTTIYLNDEVVYSWDLPYYDSFGKAPAKSIMIYNNELNNMALAEVVGNLCKNYDLDFRKGYKLVFEHE